MKKILLAAFGLLLYTSVTSQQQQQQQQQQFRNKDNAMQGRRQLQNSRETNVAGQRIITNLWGMDYYSGIAREWGTDAVANSYTSSNKPKPYLSSPADAVTNKKAQDTESDKGSALVGSSKSPDNARRSDRTSVGATPVGAPANKKNMKEERTRANTPVGKPKVHPPKYRSKGKGESR